MVAVPLIAFPYLIVKLFFIKVEDLKPGGRDIPVTSSNKIEYIHLMADYRLNKQVCR